ncbi:MAG TPA: hypothetical protein VG847_17395 [Chitinophagaceae bacterium]|nr:hypothetical protein [Chitinophagaceae bacterium]
MFPKRYAEILTDRPKKLVNKALNLFWTGYVIYIVCYMLMISAVVPAKITYLQLLGVALFVPPAIYLVRFKIESSYFRFMFVVYTLWSIYIVSRGFEFNKDYLFATLVEAYGGIFLYLVPFIALFPKNLIYLKKIFNVILILSVIYLLCDVVFIKALLASDSDVGKTVVEYFAKIAGIPCGFILLTLAYYSEPKKSKAFLFKLYVFSVIVLTFLLAAIRARRGLTFMAANILILAYFYYNYSFKSNLFFKFFPLLILFFVSIYAVAVFTDNSQNGMFRNLKGRIKEDTRSDVEDYFYIDLSQKDWLIGKGIEGKYYCPTGATEDGYRGVIETDYLEIILKGGLVNLVLLALITVPAVILGLFYSKNILSKAAAGWIILWMLALYPATVTTFALNYLLVWISIGICYSKTIRNIPEEIMRQYFQYKIL